MGRLKKISIIIGSLLILYSLIGFLIIPFTLESILPDKLSKILHRPVSIQHIRLNPFALTAAIEGLNIQSKTPKGTFIAFDRLFVNIQTASLFKRGLIVKEIRLEHPDIFIVRRSESAFNFSDLIPEKSPEAKPAETETDAAPVHFNISNISIMDGKLSFQDDLIHKTHVLSAINFTLPDISNFDKKIDSYAEPLLTAALNQAHISVGLDTKPFHDSLETIARVSISDVHLPYYFAYVPEKMLGFKISNGRLNVDAQISFMEKNKTPEVTVQGSITLTRLEMTDKQNHRILNLPELKMDVAPSHPLAQQLTLASVMLQSPEVYVSRSSDHIINLSTLGPAASESPENKQAPPPEADADSKENTTPPPFQFKISEFLLNSGSILFTDHAVTSPDEKNAVEISISDIGIKISEFSTLPETTAAYELHAKINHSADISAAGTLGMDPLSIETDFGLKDLALPWGQPYLPESIHLRIADGKFNTSGALAVHRKADETMAITFTGKAAVNELNALESSRKTPFVAWKTLALDGINVSLTPLKISTDNIMLADVNSQFIIFDDGTSNIHQIFSPPDKTNTPEAESKEKGENPEKSQIPPIRIGEIHLDNFDFKFSDQKITPHFSTRLNLADLRVTGLNSDEFKSADLSGTGTIDQYAPMKINGSLNPLKEDPFIDITYTLENMELSPLSPYTGKYIGRAIEKGKFSTDIAYKIESKEITAQNQILLDQFTLGQNVPSKDALNLPVGVAIALLKDRNGRISIDLPIKGRTDDPSFEYGKPLLKALKNLIVKAATAPFDLIGALVGGGEELRYIEFEPGAFEINAKGSEKLNAVKKLMYERPAFKVDISGYIDTEADRNALIEKQFIKKIKTRKQKADAAQKKDALDKIALSPEEYPHYVKQIYTDIIQSDPENKKNLKPLSDPKLTPEAMASAIRDEITIPDAEIHTLAQQRARQVKQYLLKDGRITSDRLFLTAPKTLSPVQNGEFKAARVELNVR